MTSYQTITLDDGTPLDVTVLYSYEPAERGARGPHGEQLEPDLDSYFEIEAVLSEKTGECILSTLTPQQLTTLEDDVCNRP